MDKATVEKAIEKALVQAEAMVKETNALPPDEREQRVKEMARQVKLIMDKKLEDHSDMQKFASSLHLKSLVKTMPPAQAWIVDCFVVAVGFFIREKDKEAFIGRMERIVDYIIDYREFFEPDPD